MDVYCVVYHTRILKKHFMILFKFIDNNKLKNSVLLGVGRKYDIFRLDYIGI